MRLEPIVAKAIPKGRTKKRTARVNNPTDHDKASNSSRRRSAAKIMNKTETIKTAKDSFMRWNSTMPGIRRLASPIPKTVAARSPAPFMLHVPITNNTRAKAIKKGIFKKSGKRSRKQSQRTHHAAPTPSTTTITVLVSICTSMVGTKTAVCLIGCTKSISKTKVANIAPTGSLRIASQRKKAATRGLSFPCLNNGSTTVGPVTTIIEPKRKDKPHAIPPT